MCELNYKGTKIEIGVKLRDQKYNFTYKKWSFYGKSLRCWHVTLTCDNQRLRLTVNVQIRLPRPILHRFIKLENQIYKLNYKKTKSVIRDKVRTNFIILSWENFNYLIFILVMSLECAFLKNNKILLNLPYTVPALSVVSLSYFLLCFKG